MFDTDKLDEEMKKRGFDIDDSVGDYRTESIKQLLKQLYLLQKKYPSDPPVTEDKNHVAQHARHSLRLFAATCVYGMGVHEFLPFAFDLALAAPNQDIRIAVRDAATIAFGDILGEVTGKSTVLKDSVEGANGLLKQTLDGSDLMDTLSEKLKEEYKGDK